jgi:hypothetical protein
VYVHFYLKVLSATSEGDYIMHLGPSVMDTVFRARVFIRKYNDEYYQPGISKNGKNPVWANKIIKFNSINGFVIRYTFNNGSNTDDEAALSFQGIDFPIAVTGQGELDTKVDIGTLALRQG